MLNSSDIVVAIYSLCTFYLAFQLLSNKLPFGDTEDGATEDEIYEKANNCELDFSGMFWDEVSMDARDFIRFLLNPNERKRPTAEKALNHKWLRVSVAAQADQECPPLRLDRSEVAKEALTNFREYVLLFVLLCLVVATKC